MSGPALAIYVVYKDPRDYPDKLVVRRWLGLVADEIPLAVTDDLAIARNVIPDYCVPFQRSPDDDPAILEVWL
jgi:hypothetical protein